VPDIQLFISDLHLTPQRPEINRAFFAFLAEEARAASELYILGDLFDYWIGDDDLGDGFNASIAAALCDLAETGCVVSFMPGNRDFLLGSGFAAAAGMRVLGDPTRIELSGTPTLLLHGDTLCTDDHAYQAFRAKVHGAAWQRGFLAKTLAERRTIAQGLREESRTEQTLKTDAIMDVAPAAVEQAFREHACTRMIHGHTHRPACHRYMIEGRVCERWVLGAWYSAGSYLQCDRLGRLSAQALAAR